MSELIQALRGCLGSSHVLTDPAEMAPYCTDWRGRYSGVPRCVVRPATTDEVAAAVVLCCQYDVPMVPQGGNTGLVGGATPMGGEVVFSLGRMNRHRALDTDNQTLVVEAGCTLAAAQNIAAEAGLLFPLSLASEGTATVGGIVSTNAGGVQVLRYGTTRDLVLGLEVVLPDGRIWSNLRGLRKDNTGYDLKQLFIGAEGTLGMVTAAALKLFPAPQSSATGWVGVNDPQAALALLAYLQRRMGDRLTAFELINAASLHLVVRYIPDTRPPFAVGEGWWVLVELSDVLSSDLAELLTNVFADAHAAGLINDATVATSEAQSGQLWKLRESISEAQRIEGISIKHDISLPRSRIPAFLDDANARLKMAFPGIRTVCFGHLGDGNLHYNLSKPIDQDNRAFIDQTPQVNRLVHDLVDEMGGSISAEHGLGQLKRMEILRYKAPVEREIMQSLKRTLDPKGLMNPGKLIA